LVGVHGGVFGNAEKILLPDGTYRGVTAAEARGEKPIPEGARFYVAGDLQSDGSASEPQPFEYLGKTYKPSPGKHRRCSGQ